MSGENPNAAILLTAPASAGPAAIAVLRIRGTLVKSFLQKHFSKLAEPGKTVHGELRDSDRTIDDPLVVVSEDFSRADINLHGGTWIVSSALELAVRNGFQIVESEQRPSTDLAHEEIDSILGREVLTNLPLAKTALGIDMLLKQPSLWRAANLSELDPVKTLRDVSLWSLLHPPRVAIVGEANVGKSTLANRLFGQERSITADVPGTTRDWVGELADLDGLPVLLLDTAGRRETPDAIEQAAIAAGVEQVRGSDWVIHVLDATRRPSIEFERDALMVVNKIDQPPAWDFTSLKPMKISAKTGVGIDELIQIIRARFGLSAENLNTPIWWTERQCEILKRAKNDARVVREVLG